MTTFGAETRVPAARVFLLSVTVLVLHVMLFSRFSLFAVRPEPFMLLTIVGALQLGPSGGALLGCSAGLAADLLSSSPLGLWMLVCGVIGLGLGTLRGQLSQERQSTTTIFAVLSCTLVGLLLYPTLSYAVSETRFPPPLRFLTVIVFACLWNLLLAPLFAVTVRVVLRPKRTTR